MPQPSSYPSENRTDFEVAALVESRAIGQETVSNDKPASLMPIRIFEVSHLGGAKKTLPRIVRDRAMRGEAKGQYSDGRTITLSEPYLLDADAATDRLALFQSAYQERECSVGGPAGSSGCQVKSIL